MSKKGIIILISAVAAASALLFLFIRVPAFAGILGKSVMVLVAIAAVCYFLSMFISFINKRAAETLVMIGYTIISDALYIGLPVLLIYGLSHLFNG